MSKLSCTFTVVLFFSLASSCSEDKLPDPQPVLPTKSDIEGYWKLTKIIQSGTPISFEEYVSPNSGKGVKNQYYYFNSTGGFVETTELSVNVIIWQGQWEVKEDRVNANYATGGSAKYKVDSFSQNEITLVNQFALEYSLVFTRIEKNDYPESLMSASVDGQNYTSASFQAYLEKGGYIQLTGNFKSDFSDWMSITLNNPTDLVAGATYTIGDAVISALYKKGDTVFGSSTGQLKVEKIRSDYIDVTFSLISKSVAGAEVNITNGKFMAIVKNNQ